MQPPAAAGPPVKPNSIIAVADHGAPSKPDADAEPAIRAILDALPNPANVRLDLGVASRIAGRPIVVAKANVEIQGEGTALTTFQQSYMGPTVIVGPLGDLAADGFSFAKAGRPDLFGLADATLAKAPGQRYGFATQGRTILYCQGNAAQLGGFTDAKWWDYWSTSGGATIEFLISGKIAPGQPILAMGGFSNPVGLGVVAASGDQPNTLIWMLSLDGDALGTVRYVAFSGIDWTKPARVRLWYDPTPGVAGCWYMGPDGKGANLVGNWWGQNPPFPGRKLRANDHDFPLQLGAQGSIAGICSDPPQANTVPPQLTFGGLRVSNVAIRDDPGNDLARYGGDGPGMVFRLATETVDPGRLVRLQQGQATATGGNKGLAAFALALDALKPSGGVKGFRMSDASVVGVMLAGTYNPTLSNVNAEGGTVGLMEMKFGQNYVCRMTNCDFGGTDAAESRYSAIGVMTACNATQGGITSLREQGCSLTRIGGLATFFGPNPRSGMSILEGQYGGMTTMVGYGFDNEDVELPTIFDIANNAYEYRSVKIVNCTAARLAKGGSIFTLDSRADPTIFHPAKLSVEGFAMQGYTSSIATVNGPPSRWQGEIDARLITLTAPGSIGLAAVPIAGPGYDPAKLRITGQ